MWNSGGIAVPFNSFFGTLLRQHFTPATSKRVPLVCSYYRNMGGLAKRTVIIIYLYQKHSTLATVNIYHFSPYLSHIFLVLRAGHEP